MKLVFLILTMSATSLSTLWSYDKDASWHRSYQVKKKFKGQSMTGNFPIEDGFRKILGRTESGVRLDQCKQCAKKVSQANMTHHLHTECFMEKPCPNCTSNASLLNKLVDAYEHNKERHSILNELICFKCGIKVTYKKFLSHFALYTNVKNICEEFDGINDIDAKDLRFGKKKHTLEDIRNSKCGNEWLAKKRKLEQLQADAIEGMLALKESKTKNFSDAQKITHQ